MGDEPSNMVLQVSAIKKHLSDGGKVFISGGVRDAVIRENSIGKKEANSMTRLLDYVVNQPQKITGKQWSFIFEQLGKNGVYRTRHTLTLQEPKKNSSDAAIVVE